MSSSPDLVSKTVQVRCSLEAAFRIWTEQIDSWWPKGHSRSGDPRTVVFFEAGAGGRFYERTSAGVEFDWGRIVEWSPPHYFAFYWYLGSDPERPSRVDVHFTEQKNGETRVEVMHRGPELIGELWSQRSNRFQTSWEHVLTAYVESCTKTG